MPNRDDRRERLAEVQKKARKFYGDVLRPDLDKLYQRYAECDSNGHQKPDKDKNICGYCYRNLNVHVPSREELMMDGAEKLPFDLRPLDAPEVSRKREEYYKRMEIGQLLRGIEGLRIERQLAGLVSALKQVIAKKTD
jgi:hypothetical protein